MSIANNLTALTLIIAALLASMPSYARGKVDHAACIRTTPGECSEFSRVSPVQKR